MARDLGWKSIRDGFRVWEEIAFVPYDGKVIGRIIKKHGGYWVAVLDTGGHCLMESFVSKDAARMYVARMWEDLGTNHA